MSSETPDNHAFHVTLSDQVREADGVARMTHDGFVEAGFIAPRESGRRLVGPYLNDDVAFLMCRSSRWDVASGCGIPDGPFGIPADHAFADLTATLRGEGLTIMEGGSLVIAPQWRRSKRRLMVLLLATFIRYAGIYSPDTTMLIAVHPRDTRFYRSFLGLVPLNDRPRLFWGEPADLLASTWSEMVGYLEHSSGRLQSQLFQAAVDPDPDWLTMDVRGERLPSEWYLPLAGEDPDLTRMDDCFRLLHGTSVLRQDAQM